MIGTAPPAAEAQASQDTVQDVSDSVVIDHEDNSCEV